METLCSDEGCDHVQIRESDTCACHMEVSLFRTLSQSRQEELIIIVALENPDYEVDSEGNIRRIGGG